MNIIYLNAPQMSDSQSRVHWLITLAEGLRYVSKTADVLWVKYDDEVSHWRSYLFRAKQTRTSAKLRCVDDRICIHINQQNDMDVTQFVLPTSRTKCTQEFALNNDGLRAAVDFLHKELTESTIYSQGTNKRSLLSIEPDLKVYPPVFFGGVIKSTSLDDNARVDMQGGQIFNAKLLVVGPKGQMEVRVKSLPMTFHPKEYRAETKGMAARGSGDYYDSVYTFSKDALQTYYAQR